MAALWAPCALAQAPRLPALPMFSTAILANTQFQALQMKRQQQKALLYKEALEQIKKNPAIADLPICDPAQQADADAGRCIYARDRLPPTASRPPRKFALLFSESEYQTPIPSLDSPFKDTWQVANLLEKHFGYQAKVVVNAAKSRIVGEFNRLARQLGAGDSVVVYYAGHGYLIEQSGAGFWIPSDASPKSARTWLANADIAKLLAALPAQQVLLISDSCFSGSLTKELKVAARSADAVRQGGRAVLAMSSGGDEPVADEGEEGHSIFAWHLLNALGEVSSEVSGAQLHAQVSELVTRKFPQTPQYGGVTSAGHEPGGDYRWPPAQASTLRPDPFPAFSALLQRVSQDRDARRNITVRPLADARDGRYELAVEVAQEGYLSVLAVDLKSGQTTSIPVPAPRMSIGENRLTLDQGLFAQDRHVFFLLTDQPQDAAQLAAAGFAALNISGAAADTQTRSINTANPATGKTDYGALLITLPGAADRRPEP